MEATLRQTGNSAGMTFPAHILRDWSARPGDSVDLAG